MNIEEFRKLVQERSKSIKEIAREAVENEFRQRKSRRRGRGGGSSSSEEDNDSDNEEISNKKEEIRPLKRQKKEKVSLYRDRAKERREGKNVDYAETMALLEGVTGAEDGDDSLDKTAMSKYLGGDEAHTHLVKGLDIALANKVKREMGIEPDAEQDDDLDAVLQNARRELQASSPSSSKIRTVNNVDEAIKYLQQCDPKSLSSELGSDMFQYLRRTYLPKDFQRQGPLSTSAAGLAIQRATLSFAAHGHPHDRIHSWDIPRENMHASRIGDAAEDSNPASTLLNDKMLERVKSALRERKQTSQKAPSKVDSRPNQSLSRIEQGAVGTCKNAEPKPDDGSIGNDSDDDIFADAGDYVPASLPSGTPTETKKDKSKSDKTSTKGSFFEGLTNVNDASADVRHIARAGSGSHRLKKSIDTAPKQHVIDRDLLGTRSKVGEKKRAVQGVSVEYGGGYGEEMDVDFDGRLGDDEDAKTKKKDRTKSKAVQP